MLPTGTVTFLFTDIEGSTPLWEQLPSEMQEAELLHHAVLRRAIESNGGHVFQIVGDAFQAAFRLASDAVCAAIEVQSALREAQWGATGPIRVRMGLHTGPAELSPTPGPGGEPEYLVSHTLNRSARVMSAGHGGQILLSQVTAGLVERDLPPGVSLCDLGEHRLKGMSRLEHLFQLTTAGLPQSFPPLATAVTQPHNLPAHLSSFIGREDEIAEVCLQVRQHRLVTLTGAGGTGKTRLALRAAEEMLDGFPEGVWFVELAPVSDPELVVQTVASTLGLQKTSESSYQSILDSYLHGKRLLLLLDNCEHLLEASAGLATHLLQQCPHLSMLATSREALGISGETAYRVPSLDAPDPAAVPSPADLAQAESVRLFVERAAAVQPDFTLTSDSLQAAARICRRLDGIPLAIELAAARVIALSVEQIAARLDDRFRLLTGGSRAVLPRHRTLRASIDWSYNLLAEAERRLLQRLSIFVGGWTLSGAEAVCAREGLEAWEILDGLTGLVAKSLVMTVSQAGPETRYRMLETIRQYAQERLDDSGQGGAVRDRHLAYFLSMAERYEPQLHSPLIFDILALLDLDLDNLRAALTWALERSDRTGVEQALRLLTSLFYYWYARLLISETDGWMSRALQRMPEDSPAALYQKAWGLLVLALLKYQFEYYVRETLVHLNDSIALFRQAGRLPGVPLKLAFALAARRAAFYQYLHLFPPEPSINKELAQQDGEEILSLLKASLDDGAGAEIPWFISWTYLLNVGKGDTDIEKEEIFSFTKRAHELAVQRGDQVAELLILNTLVWLYLPGDPAQCMTLAKQGVTLARRLGDKGSGSVVGFYGTLGLSAYLIGQYYEMEDYFRSIEDIFRNSTVEKNVWGDTWNTRMRGVAAVNQRDLPKAQLLLASALDLSLDSGDSYGVLSTFIHFAGVAILLGQFQAGVRLLGFVERQCEGFFKAIDTMPDTYEFGKHTGMTKEALGETEFSRCWAQGRAMAHEQAVQLARSLSAPA